MSPTKKEIQSKNPTELLRDQVIALNEIQQSMVNIKENQIKILESLSGLYILNQQSLEDNVSVSVSNVEMPFGSMVNFMVKWTIASIPAAIILIGIVSVILLVLTIFFGGVSQIF